MASPAQEAIVALHDVDGRTFRSIAAAVGRDPSYVRRIYHGRTPGHHIADTLQAIARGERPPIPGYTPQGRGGARARMVHDTPVGPVGRFTVTQLRMLMRHLGRRIREGDDPIAVRVRYVDDQGVDQEVELFRNSGIRPSTIRRRIRNLGWRQARTDGDRRTAVTDWLIQDSPRTGSKSDLARMDQLLSLELTPLGGSA